MSSIYLRNGIYYYKGFNQRFSLKTRDKRQAKKLQKKHDIRIALAKVRGTDIQPIEVPLFREAISKYLHYKEQNFSERTVRTDSQRLKWISDFVGNISLNKIDVDTIVDYVAFRSKTVKPATIRIDLVVWKALLNFYYKRSILKSNPFRLYPIKTLSGKLEYLSLPEIEALKLYATETQPWLPKLIQLALLTGFRRGELISLKWRDINKNTIEVMGKTGRRYFPINRGLRSLLDSMDKDGVFIFHSTCRPDQPLNEDFVSRQVKKVFREIGYPETYTLHTLRHTFASHLALTGHSIQEISALLGHTSIQVTMIYAHLRPQDSKFNLPY